MPNKNAVISTDELRIKFEQTIRELKYVKYSLEIDDGEYRQGAVFHMWTGFVLSAIDNGIVKRNEDGFIDDY